MIDAGGVLEVSSSEALGTEKTTRWAEPCPLTKNLTPCLPVSFRVTLGDLNLLWPNVVTTVLRSSE